MGRQRRVSMRRAATRPAVLELRGQAIPLDVAEVHPRSALLPPERHWQPPATASAALPMATVASTPESAETAAESAETAPSEGISEVEQAMIRGAVQAGKGKTESLQALKGYSGRHHRAYSAAWEDARVSLHAEPQ